MNEAGDGGDDIVLSVVVPVYNQAKSIADNVRLSATARGRARRGPRADRRLGRLDRRYAGAALEARDDRTGCSTTTATWARGMR